jgi:hypothetical protein
MESKEQIILWDMNLANRLTLSSDSQKVLALATIRLMDLDIASSSDFEAGRRIQERNKLVDTLGEVVPIGARHYSSALNGKIAEELSRLSPELSRVNAAMILSETSLVSPWSKGEIATDIRRIALKDLATLLRLPQPELLVDQIINGYLPKSRSFKKIALITLFSIAGGFIAAPHLGAAIGAAMGLSGAAATSAGLAALGFGSVAAGGFGMAGGTVIVGALAGVVGGGTSLKLASDQIKSNPELEALKLRISLHVMNAMPETHPMRTEIINSINNGIENAKKNLTSYEKQVADYESKLRTEKSSTNKSSAQISDLKSKIKTLKKGKIAELEEEIELLRAALP